MKISLAILNFLLLLIGPVFASRASSDSKSEKTSLQSAHYAGHPHIHTHHWEMFTGLTRNADYQYITFVA